MKRPQSGPEQPSEPTLVRSTVAWLSARPGLLVAVAATLLALVVTMPMALHPTAYIYGTPGDATGAVAIFWWWGYALTHGKPLLDNTLQGVPLGSDWSQMAFSPLPLFVFAPLSVVLGPIVTYNLLILSGFPLTAWATFHLAKRLGVMGLGAAFAGLTFAFTPYHLEKALGHANQTHLEMLVGGLLMLAMWRLSGRLRYPLLAGVLFGLQIWFEPSIAYVMALALATFMLVSTLVGLVGAQRKILVVLRHAAAGALMLAATAPFVPVAAFFLHRPGTPPVSSGPLALIERTPGELDSYGARLHEYLQPYASNPLVPASIRQSELAHLHGSNIAESTILLGYTVIVLGLIGVALTRRLFPVALAIALIAFGAFVAQPPDRLLFGHTLHMPSHYLFKIIPSFRVYARFSWLVLLGGCLLAGMGLAVLQSRLKPGRIQLLLLVPFLLAAIEFNNMPPAHVTQILPAPAEYSWLADQPAGVLLEYPANAGDGLVQQIQIRQYLLYQMVHLHPTFLTEIDTGAASKTAKQLEPYYAPGVVAHLKALGVRYVFVHAADYRADGFDVPRYVDGLSYVRTLDGVDIFTVD